MLIPIINWAVKVKGKNTALSQLSIKNVMGTSFALHLLPMHPMVEVEHMKVMGKSLALHLPPMLPLGKLEKVRVMGKSLALHLLLVWLVQRSWALSLESR